MCGEFHPSIDPEYMYIMHDSDTHTNRTHGKIHNKAISKQNSLSDAGLGCDIL